MNYYLLEHSEDEKDHLPGKSPILLNSYELNGFDLRTLWRGKNIEQWPDNIQLYFEKGNVLLDYVPNVLSWLIFTDKAIDLLKKINVSTIQCFPIDIFKKGHKEKFCTVKVVNVLETVLAFDWEKSDYVSWEDAPKYIKFIRKIVLKADAPYRNLDMFRLDESKNYIVISQRFKDEVEKKDLKGFGFTLLEFA